MDLLALDAWARQAAAIAGATVRKVSLRGPGLFELTLSGPGSPGFLCWSFAGPDPVICLLAERLDAGDPTGEVDPGLRRSLEKAVVTGIACLYPERRLEIEFRPAIPKITPGPLRLVLELRPPGGGLVVDGAGKVRWREGEVPPLSVSLPPPPESFPVAVIAGIIEGKTPSEAAKGLPRAIFGIPPWLAREALSGEPPETVLGASGAARVAEAIRSLLADYRSGRGGWVAVAANPSDRDSAWKVVGRPGGETDINFVTAAALHSGRDAAARAAIRRPLARYLRRYLEKSERTLGAVIREIPSPEENALQRGRGELLLAYLRQVPSGAASVALPSFEDPQVSVTIPLDPAISPQRNAAACFTRARKGDRAMREKAGRRDELGRRIALATALLDAVSETDDLETLRLLSEKIERPAASHRGRDADAGPSLPVRVFARPGGETVLVGRNAAGNEMIYRHLSRGADLWLHARDWPGSHALVRSVGPGGATEETSALAAALAAWFSKGRGAGKVEVVATLRRNLRKPPGSAPGTVTLRLETSIAVNLEDQKVRAMLREAGVEHA